MPLTNGRNYVFINKESGTALDLDTGNNTTVQGWARHGGPNQQWQAATNGSITNWVFKNIGSNTFLSYQGFPGDGQKVTCQHDPHGWIVTGEGDNVYTFHVVDHDAICIDLADHGNANNGTPVHLWSGSGNQNQKWEAQEVA